MALETTVAVLAYHKIGYPSVPGWDTWSYVSEALFEEHLRFLADERWQVLDLEAFLAGIDAPETLPERAAIITFDDGYRSNLDVALPLLQRFGYPAVMFVPTGFVGGYNAFDADIEHEPREDICGWDDLRVLERCGVNVQSHGTKHRAFSQLGPEARKQELVISKAALEAELDKAVLAFAFPYGDDGGDREAAASLLTAAGYRAAFLYGGGPLTPPVGSPFALTRIPIGAGTSLTATLQERRA